MKDRPLGLSNVTVSYKMHTACKAPTSELFARRLGTDVLQHGIFVCCEESVVYYRAPIQNDPNDSLSILLTWTSLL